MRIILFKWLVNSTLYLLVIVGFNSCINKERSNIDYVNPFIGTGDSDRPSLWESNGGAYPGAALPFGMVQSTPEAYKYDILEIASFSLINHTSGYPKGSSGNFHLMPFSIDFLSLDSIKSSFSHDNEKACPGYYSVVLDKENIQVETTVTPRNALLRFTYYEEGNRRFALFGIDSLTIMNDRSIQGLCAGRYFIMSMNCGVKVIEKGKHYTVLEVVDASKSGVMVKVGFSLTSIEKAISNQEEELNHWDMERVIKEAKVRWEKYLDLIEIRDNDELNKEIFYTALYHSFLDPHLISDVGDPVRYSGLSPWDTYQSKQPLITLLAPEAQKNMISSVLDVFDKKGKMNPGPMTADHNVPILLDSYRKGIEMDASKAYLAMESSLLQPPYSRRDFSVFLDNGFVPASTGYSVTKTLEYAYNYWAMYEMAKDLNKSNDMDSLYKWSFAYHKIYHPDEKFMTARSIKGAWKNGGYREGDKWAYNWSATHDIRGLINLSGGSENFVNQLQESFAEGHYYHDNEPPLHNVYLFSYAGRPWLTQKWVGKILSENYSNTPGGLPGNDDLGALSAWYVFSAMGFYPVCPGRPEYILGTPLFDKVTINLPREKKLIIEAQNLSGKNRFVHTKKMNGKSYPQLFINHSQLVNGMHFTFEMSPEVQEVEIAEEKYLPQSLTTTTPEIKVLSWDMDKDTVAADEEISIFIKTVNSSGTYGCTDIIVQDDGSAIKSKGILIGPDETADDIMRIKLYRSGLHHISIGKHESKSIFVKSGIPPTFLYSEVELPQPPIISVDSTCTISVTIKNIGSATGKEQVKLTVNGNLSETTDVEIAPGQTKKVSFQKVFDNPAISQIQIGSLPSRSLLVYGRNLQPNAKLKHSGSLLVDLNFNMRDNDKRDAESIKIHGNVRFVKGIFGEAIQTDATKNAYVEIKSKANHREINEGEVCTMMMWIYPLDEENFSDIISRGDLNVIQVRASNTEVNYYSGGWQRGEAYSLLPEDWNRHWHHIAGVSNEQELKLYIDGALVAKKDVEDFDNGGLKNMIVPWNIGRNAHNTDRNFNGYIDEVKIFNKSLNHEEVIAHMLNVTM